MNIDRGYIVIVKHIISWHEVITNTKQKNIINKTGNCIL